MARKKSTAVETTDVSTAETTETTVETVTETVKETIPVSTKKLIGYIDPCDIILEIGKKSIRINGNTANLRGASTGTIPVGVPGLTMVDAEDWEEITKKYAKLPAIKSGRLFAADTRDAFDGMAKERKRLRSGKEPVNVETRSSNPA